MDRMLRYGMWEWALLVVFFAVVGQSTGWAATNTFPTDGNVGIGTMTPSDKLEVWGNLRLRGTANGFRASGGPNIGVDFNFDFPDISTAGGNFRMYRLTNTTGSKTFTIFKGDGTGTWQNRFNAAGDTLLNLAAGNLGVGTATPTYKLHVVGDAFVSGNIAAKYQDVAEWVPTKSALLPGTVVIIDPQASNQVLPAAKPYDTRVAGVVSTQPGLLLGEAEDDKAKIAHSGRVPVKVDASFGPIAAGDLLVTSPTPGYAMRSTPVDLGGIPMHRPGTLVGKALEPLAAGQGEILVLLTLQ